MKFEKWIEKVGKYLKIVEKVIRSLNNNGLVLFNSMMIDIFNKTDGDNNIKF